MLITSALDIFKTRAAIARALADARSASSVYLWDEVVPLAAAQRLEKIVGKRKLRVDRSLYNEFGHIIRKRTAA